MHAYVGGGDVATDACASAVDQIAKALARIGIGDDQDPIAASIVGWRDSRERRHVGALAEHDGRVPLVAS